MEYVIVAFAWWTRPNVRHGVSEIKKAISFKIDKAKKPNIPHLFNVIQISQQDLVIDLSPNKFGREKMDAVEIRDVDSPKEKKKFFKVHSAINNKPQTYL